MKKKKNDHLSLREANFRVLRKKIKKVPSIHTFKGLMEIIHSEREHREQRERHSSCKMYTCSFATIALEFGKRI